MPAAKIFCNQWNQYKWDRWLATYIFNCIVEVRSPLTTLSSQPLNHQFSSLASCNFNMTTNVSLSDQYVLLLQNVVQENRLLREQLSNTVSSNESALNDIKTQMDILVRTNTSSRRVRQTGQNTQKVPKACSVSKRFESNVFVYLFISFEEYTPDKCNVSYDGL